MSLEAPGVAESKRGREEVSDVADEKLRTIGGR
jgi:hypothetical protein